MKRFLVTAAAVGTLLASAVAVAENTQVSPSSLKASGTTGFIGGRSDGMFQDAYTGSAVVVENGQRARVAGVGYRETFAYGATDKGLTQLDQSNGGTCAGNTTTVPCTATFGSGLQLVWFPIVTATLPLSISATGLDIAGDQTDNDGNEVAGGILGASGRPFIVGDDPAFYFCSTMKLADVSGSDQASMGFRRTGAFNAVFTSYTDYATIGSISGNVETSTQLNGGGNTNTDLTAITDWADAGTHTLCVGVGASGAVKYSYDGSIPSQSVAFTFDDGDAVIPFWHMRHDADLMDTANISLWQVGYCLNDNAPASTLGTTYVAKAVCDAVQ